MEKRKTISRVLSLLLMFVIVFSFVLSDLVSVTVNAEVKTLNATASSGSYISPEVMDDGSVVIRLDTNDAAIPEAYKNLKAGDLYLMGTVTDWNAGVVMDYDEGVFSLVINAADGSGIQVTPGKYEYKFKTASGTWFADPANEEKASGSDPNSVLNVPGVVIEGQDLAGAGSTKYIATGSYDEIIDWTVSGSENSVVPFEGLTIISDTDKKTATVTADKNAESGWYYVTVKYAENGVNKKQTFAFYHTKRALIYEYEYKAASKYKDKSDLYAWYNAAKSNVGYSFVPMGTSSKVAAYIPIDNNTNSFGYIVRNYAAWGDNDREFTDRTLEFNNEERYIKVQGGEGIEKPYMLSGGITDYNNGSIIFRYRDDQLFYDGAMDSVKSAKLMLKAPGEDSFKEYNMSYNSKDELFTYELKNDAGLAGGEYQFYYAVEFTEGVITNVADLYYVPEAPSQAEGVDVAVIEYQHYDYDITAKVTPENGANYDENPLVSLSVMRQGEDDTEVNAIENGEISVIKADLTSLGYDGKIDISAITGKGVLYIDQSVTAGTKNVPITLEDIYGNTYEISAKVKVVGKSTKDHDWDESVIYFLLTDRFYDGNASNNYGVDKSVREDYHGGDFKGLTEKMDYIADLGVNTIWITPIVDNIESFMSDETDTMVGGYAGYWACDFTKIDEHLGTQAEFDAMLDKAHEKGIKVMLDVVVNHAGYDKDDEKEWNHDSSPFSGMIRPLAEAGADSITQWLSGLPDFMTEDQEVRAQLIKWQKAWADYETTAGNGVDYFRIDTVKHVDHETWSQLKSEIAETNPGFKMIGEYYGASYTNTGDYLANGQMDSLLDFDFKTYAKNFVEGSIDSVEKSLETRNAAINNFVTMGQFLSSHDENGFLNSVGGDTSKMKVAAALELTAKGQPIIYYGEEINLTGDTKYGSDKNNRYDMQFDNLSDDQKAMLSHYKKLIAVRNAKTDVFAKGNRTKIAGSDEDKYLVFKRSSDSDYAYVALNTTNSAKKVTFTVSEKITSMTDLYSGQEVSVSGGKVTVTIPASKDGGTVILAASTKNKKVRAKLKNKL